MVECGQPVRLFYQVQAPLDPVARRDVVLLHGFPEFHHAWRHQLQALAAAGFRLVVPDLRGYGGSPTPPRVSDYRIDCLTSDVLDLIRRECGGRAHVVGHDWGGVIAWWLAMHHPEAVDRLVVLNAPHPAAYLRELRRPAQLLRSWYVGFFQLPWLPEFLLRFDDFAALRRLFKTEARFSHVEVERCLEAFTDRRSLCGAVNYYRAAFREGQTWLRRVRRIDAPTLLIWGEKDRYLVPELAQGLARWITHLRVERLHGATHWVQHDEPERVNRLLSDFLRE
jgi:pimeloyl-ACP methyl ester carboxylesterase